MSLQARFFAILILLLISVLRGWAEEGRIGHHIVGTGGPSAGRLPAEPGFVLKESLWLYSGETQFSYAVMLPVVGALGGTIPGRIDVDLNAKIALDALTVQYATPWKVLGGRLNTAVIFPFINVDVDEESSVFVANKKVSTLKTSQSAFGFADIKIMPAIIGWEKGDFHWLAALSIYAPTGEFNKEDIAQLGLNYWTFEPAFGFTWLNEKRGHEVSFTTGVTFNTTNPETDFRSGTQFFFDWTATQRLAKGFSLGAGGYVYEQITRDRAPADVSVWNAQAFGIGPAIQYSGKIMGHKFASDIKWFHEFNVRNHFEGDVIWLHFTLYL